MWIDHPEFHDLVASDWAKPMHESPGLIFWRKLTRLKHMLQRSNWSVFGNVFTKKKELHEQIEALETQLHHGWSDTVHNDWDKARKEFSKVEAWENELLCHKARMKWTKDGDRNSAFYHAVIREKTKRQLIQITREHESVSTVAPEIGLLAHDYFSNLFTASSYHLDQGLFEGIQPAIFEDDNQLFSSLPPRMIISDF